MAFCNFKLCLLATRNGDDSSQRRQLYVNKLKVKLSLKISPPFIHIKRNKENRLNWGAILFVVPKETNKHRRGFGEKEEEAQCWCWFDLRTFAPIVSAHPYCARNSLRDIMPRHALSARAVEEMWRYIALVGTLISMHGFNSLKCSVTPYFLLVDHFRSLIFFNFSALASSNSTIIEAARCSLKSILEVEFN